MATTRALSPSNTSSLPIIGQPSKRDQALRRKMETSNKSTTSLYDSTRELWTATGLSAQDVNQRRKPKDAKWAQAKPIIHASIPGNFTKAENPNILGTLTKELLASKYQDHHKVYTDGSILEDGSAGSAAVTPSQDITLTAKLNRGVSIFTAELMAILLACLSILRMPDLPKKAAILTDSKSALQALSRKRCTNREHLVNLIHRSCHTIIGLGTTLTLQWLPSHTGIRGNCLADSSAKQATRKGCPVNLRLSVSEVKARLNSAAINLHDRHMKATCQANGWLFQPTNGPRLRQGLPRKSLRLLSCLRTNCHRAKNIGLSCTCGAQPTLQHLTNPCQLLRDNTTGLHAFQKQHQLQPVDYLQPHSVLGLAPCKALADSIYAAGIESWF